jgi:hypothetical protein
MLQFVLMRAWPTLKRPLSSPHAAASHLPSLLMLMALQPPGVPFTSARSALGTCMDNSNNVSCALNQSGVAQAPLPLHPRKSFVCSRVSAQYNAQPDFSTLV